MANNVSTIISQPKVFTEKAGTSKICKELSFDPSGLPGVNAKDKGKSREEGRKHRLEVCRCHEVDQNILNQIRSYGRLVYHVISYYVMLYDFISYHIISYHMIWQTGLSYHITSKQIKSNENKIEQDKPKKQTQTEMNTIRQVMWGLMKNKRRRERIKTILSYFIIFSVCPFLLHQADRQREKAGKD